MKTVTLEFCFRNLFSPQKLFAIDPLRRDLLPPKTKVRSYGYQLLLLQIDKSKIYNFIASLLTCVNLLFFLTLSRINKGTRIFLYALCLQARPPSRYRKFKNTLQSRICNSETKLIGTYYMCRIP